MADPKRLTVSYGAFTCTVEGFDEPFSIMKMVVDYFQSLTGSDPGFGSEPIRIDPDEVSRRAVDMPDVGDVEIALDSNEADHITIRNREATVASMVAAAATPSMLPESDEPIIYSSVEELAEGASEHRVDDDQTTDMAEAPDTPETEEPAPAAAEVGEDLATEAVGEDLTPDVELVADDPDQVAEDAVSETDDAMVAEATTDRAPADLSVVETIVPALRMWGSDPDKTDREDFAAMIYEDIAAVTEIEETLAAEAADSVSDVTEEVETAYAPEIESQDLLTASEEVAPEAAQSPVAADAEDRPVSKDVAAQPEQIVEVATAEAESVVSGWNDTTVEWDDEDDEDWDLSQDDPAAALASSAFDQVPTVPVATTDDIAPVPEAKTPILHDVIAPTLEVATSSHDLILDQVVEDEADMVPEFDHAFELDELDEAGYESESTFLDRKWHDAASPKPPINLETPEPVVGDDEPVSLDIVVHAAEEAAASRADAESESTKMVLRPRDDAEIEALTAAFDPSSLSDIEEVEDDDHEDEEAWNAVFNALNTSRAPLSSYVEPEPKPLMSVAGSDASDETPKNTTEPLDPIEREEAALRRVLAALESQGDTILAPRSDNESATKMASDASQSSAVDELDTLGDRARELAEDFGPTSLPTFAPPKLDDLEPEKEEASTPRRRITLRRRTPSPNERPIQELDENETPIGRPWAAVDPLEGPAAGDPENAPSHKFRLPFHATIFGSRQKPASELDVSSKLARGLMDDDDEAVDSTQDVMETAEQYGNTPFKIVQGSAADALEEGENELREFARKFGAASLPDLLEASAAYETLIRGESLFSRQQIMKTLDELGQERDYTTEARIKSFGKLLRKGSIVRVEDGKFALSHSARFNYEAKLGTG